MMMTVMVMKKKMMMTTTTRTTRTQCTERDENRMTRAYTRPTREGTWGWCQHCVQGVVQQCVQGGELTRLAGEGRWGAGGGGGYKRRSATTTAG